MSDLALPRDSAALGAFSAIGAAVGAACHCGRALPFAVRLGLRSRTRPVFESRWTCTADCLREQVRGAVQREWSSGLRRRPHQHRVPLGLVLLSAGAITQAQLQAALMKQRRSGKRIGDVLIQSFGLTETQLAAAFAVQWNCAVWTGGSVRAQTMARLAPRRLLESAVALPLRTDSNGSIQLAFTHALDAQASFALQRMHGVSVESGIIPASAFQSVSEQLQRAEGIATQTVECADTSQLEDEVVRTLRRHGPVQSRLVRVHEIFWMRMWLEVPALADAASPDILDFVYLVQSPTISQLHTAAR